MRNTQLWISPRGKQPSKGMANIYPADLLWLVFGIQTCYVYCLKLYTGNSYIIYTHNYNYVDHWGTAVRMHIIHCGTSHDLACWLHKIMYNILYLSRSSRSRVMGQVLSMCYWWKKHSDPQSSLEWVGTYLVCSPDSCPSLTCWTCMCTTRRWGMQWQRIGKTQLHTLSPQPIAI